METVLVYAETGTRPRIVDVVERVGIQYVVRFSLDDVVDTLYSSGIKVVLVDHDQCKSPDSLEVVRTIQQRFPSVQVIVLMKSVASQLYIQLIGEGAFDVIADYHIPEKLVRQVERATQTAQSYSEHRHALADRPLLEPEESSSLIGNSLEMIEIYKTIGQVARSNATVLIEGETGTGKGVVAREIVANSLRADKPFQVMNCAVGPETLLESELFGHEKGAFTDAKNRKLGKLEVCNGGTLFLDEIGDMSQSTQAKVLRVIQEQAFERVGGNETIHVDVRLIAATNKSLVQLSKAGKFRWDLFYRLKVISIHLPALRERGDDVMLLAKSFLRKYSTRLAKEVRGFHPMTIEILNASPWPGNVRELENVVQAAVVRCKGHLILPEDLDSSLAAAVEGGAKSGMVEGDWGRVFGQLVDQHFPNLLRRCEGNLYGELTSALEASLIRRTLQETNGNQVQAARMLGISRNTLRDRIERFNMSGSGIS
jgi:DNA-binding NtrC family response regulator